MRAIELRSYGEPLSGFAVIDQPEPGNPGAGDILVGMEYAPVNLNDLYVMQGMFPVHPTLPSPIGNEGVGRVLAIGAGVTRVSVGDRIVLPLYSLTWRQRLIVSAADVAPVPNDADAEQLAMLRINAVTAGLLLTQYAVLGTGDWVIQNAGNSAVARTVSAIAKARGLKTINLVRRSDAVADAIAGGADAAFVDDEQALEQIRAVVGERGIGLALDGVGGAAVGRLAAALRIGGTIVSYGVLGGDTVASASSIDIIFKDLTYRGFYLDKPEYADLIPSLIAKAAELVASGQLHIPIAGIYELDDLAGAVAHAQKGGKVLLKIGTQP